MNSYGLTEATIDNAYFDGPDDGLADDGPIPIGRPYVNQRVVVSRCRRPGATGRRARRIARRRRRTGPRLPEPARPDRREIRSGSRTGRASGSTRPATWPGCCRAANWNLLGRTDTQVKVRGFRIELGEIEATLAQHPAVKEAAVVAVDDGRGVKRLVAYVVPGADVAAPVRHGPAGLPRRQAAGIHGARRVRAAGRAAAFAQRQGGSQGAAGSGPVAARTWPTSTSPRGRTPRQSWRPSGPTCCGSSGSGVRDNFFELGGHSLVATQLLSRVRAEFGVELPLRKLFETPVLADFAVAVAAAERAKLGPALTRADAAEVPMSFGQQRLWFLDRLEPGNPAYHLSVAVRLVGELDRAVFQWCVDTIVARHDALRTTFPTWTAGRRPRCSARAGARFR